jgi:hypothetical protein
MVRLGEKMTDRFFPIPVAFDLVPVLVQPAAAITVRQFVWIVVLEGFSDHKPIILYL